MLTCFEAVPGWTFSSTFVTFQVFIIKITLTKDFSEVRIAHFKAPDMLLHCSEGAEHAYSRPLLD